MNINRSRATIRQMIQLVGLAMICFAVGLALTQMLTNANLQDAFQYRQNLENGDYERQYERQDAFGIWPIIVVGMATYFWDQDPFTLIGGVTAGLFLFYSVKAQVGWGRWAIFLVLLVMPLMSLNYVQVLRQGIAVAIIIAALMANSFMIMTGLLMLAGSLHLVYVPFIALTLLRFFLFPSSAVGSAGQVVSRNAQIYDWAVFIALPFAFVLLMSLAPGEMTQKYFEFEFDNVKRVLVSLLILALITQVYPVGNQRITVFATYAGLAAAISLPFQNDFTRINTAIFPLLVFAALLCERPHRSYYALGICFILTLYISLRLEYS